MFRDLPLVDITMRTSPGLPSASTWRGENLLVPEVITDSGENGGISGETYCGERWASDDVVANQLGGKVLRIGSAPAVATVRTLCPLSSALATI